MKKLILFILSLTLITIFSTGTIAQQFTKFSDFPENVKNSKQFQRFEWFYQQRAFPYDTVSSIYANQVYYNEIQRIKKNQDLNNKLMTWYPKGPIGVEGTSYYSNFGIVSGRVKTIAVDPSDPETLYIGAASGGIWKTTDGGDTWQDIGKDLESLTYGAIAIDPNNPEIIYAGAGEIYTANWCYIYGGNGLFKSTDSGENWVKITEDFGPYTHFSDIVVSPFDSNILFASLAKGYYDLGNNLPNEGIWKSTDAGEHWYKCLDLPSGFDVMLHPNDPDSIFACIGGWNNPGFYISTDQGETWNVSNNGLPGTINRMHTDISLSNPDIIYAVIYQLYGSSRAYKSINGGENWEQISEGVNLGGHWSTGWVDNGFYNLCIAVDPLDHNHVYIGNVELHETTDGENFSPVRIPGGNTASYSIAHQDYHKLVYAPSDHDYFYIGCDGGVYCSTDGCTTAQSKSYGLETFQFYRIGSHPADPDKMIGGLQDNGTVITEDGGETWTMVMPGDGTVCFFNYQNPQIVYASHQNGNLKRSSNGGSNFSNFGDIGGVWVTPFFAHEQNPDTLYAANYDVMMRTGSSNWQPITTNLSNVKISAFKQSFINHDYMILAGYNYSSSNPYVPVMISTDRGYNWTNVTDNIPGEIKRVPQVVTHPNQENTMYIVRCGFSNGNKIYKTTDLGETWINVTGNLPDIPCNDLFIDPEITNHYYIGTDLGVYFSEDEGENWEYAGDGIPKVPVLDFDYVKIENTRYLRVATHGRGIYETTSLISDVRNNEILSRGEFMAKPNPFTSEIVIEYELQRSSNVQLSVYNQFGGKLKSLINENQSKRKHHFKMNLSDLKPGVYFCTLQTNDGLQTKKLIKVN